MTPSCQNCGHESHCGIALEKALDVREPEEMTRVCNQCRCARCSKATDEDFKEFWKIL